MKIWGWTALLSSVLALLAFADIGEDMHDPGWPALEDRLATPLRAMRTPRLTWLVLHLTWLGSQPVLAALVIGGCLIPWVTPRSRDKVVLMVGALTATGLNLGLKNWFGRARPGAESLPLVEEPYYSFPSGHAMISLVVYGILAYLIWQRRRSRIVTAVLSLLVLLIAATRVYLAVHYPGDVIAGLVAGWPILCFSIYWHRGWEGA